MPPGRLIRRKPLKERILDYLNPLDRWLSISAAIEAYDWDQLNKSIGNPTGLALNLVLLVARANAATELAWPWGGSDEGDILLEPGQDASHSGGFRGFNYLMALLSYALFLFSLVNAIHCFTKKRPYRLFEHDIRTVPATPSARRVRVNSTPNQSSPLRLVTNVVETVSNPSAMLSRTLNNTDNIMDGVTENEVWEVCVWDPSPMALKIFTLFSPAHVMVYFLALPIVPSAEDVIASVTDSSTDYSSSANPYRVILHVVITILILSFQTTFLTNSFVTQRMDEAFVKNQVLREYDAKFVQPRLNVKKRDAATSTDDGGTVEVSPSLGNTWSIKPNPAYSRHLGRVENNPYFSSPRHASTPPSTLAPVRQPIFNSGGANGAAHNNASIVSGGSMRASMLPKRVSGMAGAAVQAEPSRRRSMSPVKKTPTIWGGDVDYGVPSPVRRVKRNGAAS